MAEFGKGLEFGIDDTDLMRAVNAAINEGVIGDARDRACFLYMEPKPDTPEHAQCVTCIRWGSVNKRCEELQKNDVVDKDDSCGLYSQGKPKPVVVPSGQYTKKIVGFVSEKTRCENCNVFDNRDKNPKEWHCDLYVQLNRILPRMFKLDIYVKPRGCCNLMAPGKRNPDRFGPYGPIPDADDPNVGGLLMKVINFLKGTP